MCGKEDKGVNLGSAQAIFIILLCPYLLYILLLFCPNACRAPCTLDPDPPYICWMCGLICHCSPESSKGLTAVRGHHNPVGSNRIWHLKARPSRLRSLVAWRVIKCFRENKTASPLEKNPIPPHPYSSSVKPLKPTTSLWFTLLPLIYTVPGEEELDFLMAKREGMCEKQDVLPILWDCVCVWSSCGACCVFHANFAVQYPIKLRFMWLISLQIKE